MNIKVFFDEALRPGRDKLESSKLMSVLSVSAIADKFSHNLSGDGVKMTKILSAQYSIGDKLIVSGGEVIGKSKKSEAVFFV